MSKKIFFKNIKIIFFIFLIIFHFSGCTSIGNNRNDPKPQVLKTPAGDDISKMTLTIAAPKPIGLGDNEEHLPALVQKEFVDNFKNNGLKVLDWESLGDQYDILLSPFFDDNSEESSDFGHLPPTSHRMGGSITKTTTGYTLHMNITNNNNKMTEASYSGNFSFAELDNLTGIGRASLELFQRLGVPVTSQMRDKLTKAAEKNQVEARTALARGITAQRQGTVEALNYYNQAAIYDPALLEAANRLSRLSISVSSGNLGEVIRNDIADRRNWVALLTETEQYFDSFRRSQSMPYTLFYLNDIKRGTTNYQNETVTLSTETYLYSSGVWSLSIERTLQAIYDGLRATGKANDWRLNNWPQRGVTNLNAFSDKRDNFSVVFELVNNQNKVIGRQTLQAGGSWSLNWSGRPSINLSSADRRTLNFQNINPNDITDNLTIRIATVNGIDSETAARDGILQIRSISKEEVAANDRFRFSKGEIQGFASSSVRQANLIIPSVIWGDPVLSIRQEAFRNTGITSVTISNGVISIGNDAFSNNPINSLSVGNNVTSIGDRAFQNNNLTSVTLPESVTVIGEAAFQKHSTSEVPGVINNINIGANVMMPLNTFRISWRYYSEGTLYEGGRNSTFHQFYDANGQKAGAYTLISGAHLLDSSSWFYGDNEKAQEKQKINKRTFWISSIAAVAVGLGIYLIINNIPREEGPVY